MCPTPPFCCQGRINAIIIRLEFSFHITVSHTIQKILPGYIPPGLQVEKPLNNRFFVGTIAQPVAVNFPYNLIYSWDKV